LLLYTLYTVLSVLVDSFEAVHGINGLDCVVWLILSKVHIKPVICVTFALGCISNALYMVRR